MGNTSMGFRRFLIFISLFGSSFKLLPVVPVTWDFAALLNFKSGGVLRLHFFVFCACSILLFCLSALWSGQELNAVEFTKSLVNFLLFFLAAFFVANFEVDQLNVPLATLSLVTLILNLFQIVSYLLFNSDQGFFLFEPLSISTATNVGRFEAANLLGYIRPYAQYYEPSFMALMANIILALRYYHYGRVDVFALISIILSLSIVGYLTLFVTITIWQRPIFRILCGAAFVLILIFFSSWFRLSEISVPGTSGYERVGVIIHTIDELIERHFVPIPLGNWEALPNNSLQVIIGYYSLFAFFTTSYLLLTIRVALWGCLFGVLMTNGAIFTFTGGLLYGLLLCKR
jgi:hypothetical protein